MDKRIVELLEQMLQKLDDIKSDISWIETHTRNIDDIKSNLESR